MAGVDDAIVREYFEVNGFLVRQLRRPQTPARAKKAEEQIDLIVSNPQIQPEERKPNFILFSSELALVKNAIVVNKGLHTLKFAHGTQRSSSEIFKFLEKDVLKNTQDLFDEKEDTIEGLGVLMKILVIPGLPTHEPYKSQSMELLMSAGVNAVISFRSMLQDMVGKVEVNHSYQKSDMLQMIRILKNYDMLKSPQLELFK